MKRIIYHDNDPDGWMSAAIIKRKFPDAQTQVCIRTKEPTLVKGYDEVYMVDYSLETNQMEELYNNNNTFIWIDHHRTAIDRLGEKYTGLRRTDKSAAGLTWEYIEKTDMPDTVRYVNDYDLWNFKDENTKPFSLYMKTIEYGKEIPFFIEMIDWNKEKVKEAITLGHTLLKLTEHDIDQHIDVGITQDFLGYKAHVMYGETNRSMMANRALNKFKDIQIAVVARGAFIENGKKVFKYSLRSRKEEDINVADIARKYGGGGHTHAAAFNSEEVL